MSLLSGLWRVWLDPAAATQMLLFADGCCILVVKRGHGEEGHLVLP